ncbi:virulence RhuM family protein [Arthrobacter sp. NA-172]|uniref:virulence RhuM family protein n=1 Tax=Arthrobacter sp. NA-172 TaxID=3367524 RepID=UPI0037545CC6
MAALPALDIAEQSKGVLVAETGSSGEFIVYVGDDGRQLVQLRSVGGTVWLSQAQLAELYGTSTQNIQQRVAGILADGEVTEATINSELIVRTEGNRRVQREVKFYNLDMILAVGYRVTTPRAVQFRQWATTVLKEYLVKGFAMNDSYLKDPAGVDYFDELIVRIRSIRSSEKRFYQKIREIFAETSADYDRKSAVARTFFATIQNKLIYAVTEMTAAELVLARCDASKLHLGLTTFSGNRVKRADVEVAKNYLQESELKELDRLTVMFLDFAEDRAKRRQQILMSDWLVQTDRFLDFNERTLLKNAGNVSNEQMKAAVGQRFEDFEARRRELEIAVAQEEEVDDLSELLKSVPTLKQVGDESR